MQIETTRLCLRPLEEKERSLLAELIPARMSREGSFSGLAVILRETGEPLGIAGPVSPEGAAVSLDADTLDEEVELYIGIREAFRNKGYATEAARALIWLLFEHKAVETAAAIPTPGDQAALRVLEKLGFVPAGEGLHRYHYIDSLPGPEWREEELVTPERMDGFFDVRAQGYDQHMLSLGGKDSYRRLQEFLPYTEAPLRLLDLGCGTGLELEYVWKQAPNAHITCVDLSRGMLDLLEERYRDRRDQVAVAQASYQDWDYPRDAFDGVLSCNTMHHLWEEEKTAVYRLILQSLKPGGSYLEDDFMVDAPRAEQYRRRYHTIAASPKGGEYHIDIPFTVETQLSLLEQAGFRNLEVLHRCIQAQGSGAVLRGWK